MVSFLQKKSQENSSKHFDPPVVPRAQAGSVVGNVLYALAGLMHSKVAILASRTMIGDAVGGRPTAVDRRRTILTGKSREFFMGRAGKIYGFFGKIDGYSDKSGWWFGTLG